MALGAGSCTLVTSLADEDKARLWLFEEGYECYRQGSSPDAAYIFVNPDPQPHLFE